MLTEVAGALRRKVVDGGLRAELASQSLDALVRAVSEGTVRLADDEELVSAALLLALTLDHEVPDCLYLALAEREGAGLVTADRRLDELARQRGVASELVPSA